MKLKTILTIIFLISIISVGYAGKITHHYIDGRIYPEKSILEISLNMNECKNRGYTKKECIDIFIQFAMDKSKKSGQIEVVIWIE